MALRPGNVLNDRYEIIQEIGHGASGITYTAVDRKTHTDVVIKQLRLDLADDFKSIDLFHRETAILKNIDHPFIPDYIDSFEYTDNGQLSYVLVQEYAAGNTLYKEVKDGKRFTEQEIKDILKRLLNILEYLHTMNPPVIHRDINPKNIVLDRFGKIFLVDFGAVGSVQKNTLAAARSDTFVGTIGYMPPEQLHGKAMPASDLYSLGVTAVFLLSGKEPHELDFDHMKLNYISAVNISEELRNFIDLLIDPSIENRMDSAKIALQLIDEPDQVKHINIQKKHIDKNHENTVSKTSIGPPPRTISLQTRIKLWINNTGETLQTGLLFAGLGMIFFLGFVVFGRVLPSVRLINASAKTTGVVTAIEDVNASENDTPVYKIVFEFNPEDIKAYSQYSYTTGLYHSVGDKVTVDYLPDSPKFSVIRGARYSEFDPWVLFVTIFPIVGYFMLFQGRPKKLPAYLFLLRHGTLTNGIIISAKKNKSMCTYSYSFKNQTLESGTGKSTFVTDKILTRGSRINLLYHDGIIKTSRMIEKPIEYKNREWNFQHPQKNLWLSLLYRCGFYLEIAVLVCTVVYIVFDFL